PLLPDDHPDLGRVDRDDHLLPGPVDADLGDLRPLLAQQVEDERPDLVVLHQQVREVGLVGVPLALPADHDAGAEPGRPNLLTHSRRSPGLRLVSSGHGVGVVAGAAGAGATFGAGAAGVVTATGAGAAAVVSSTSSSAMATWMWHMRRRIMNAVPR